MVDEGSSLEELPTRAVDALLASKLRPPPPRLGSISRSRLVDALERGIERRLTLVAAPAGYGKTMMVAQWVAAAPAARIQVWVSPMASDDEPVRFWTLIAAGLQRAGVDLARDVAGFVAAGGDDIETTIIPWLTEAMTGPADLSLIVDDFDRIRSAACLTQIDLLIRQLPANAHLVLITRADPALRLSRLRVERELSEIRAADLAFTVEEATALVTSEGLHLPTVAVETMVRKCEGWPAGIYLALLAAAGSPDPAEFLDRFAGSHRFIGDYLVEEVLNQQSLEIRTFILDVSILDRFSTALADHLTDKQRSATILRTLQATNLFLIPLDQTGGWFRFHNLFRLVALGVLQIEAPERVATLRRGAAEWFETNGYVDDAIAQAIAADRASEAARMAQQNWLPYYDAGLGTTVQGWLRQLSTIGTDTAAVVVTSAWMAAVTGNEAELGHRLSQLEQLDRDQPLLDGAHSAESVAAMINGQFGFGGPALMLAAAERAAELETDTRTPWHAFANTALGHARYVTGDLTGAAAVLPFAAYSDAAPAVIQIQALAALALVHTELAHPTQARAFADQSMALVRARSLQSMPAVSLAYTAVGQSQATAGDPDAALVTLDAGLALRRRVSGLSPWPLVHHLLAISRAAILAGDRALARAVLDEVTILLSPFRDGMNAMTSRVTTLRKSQPPNSSPRPRTPILTTSELKILRRLETTLTLREIADELYLSRNTVKTHTQSLYRKLGASSRSDSVRIAHDQDLL